MKRYLTFVLLSTFLVIVTSCEQSTEKVLGSYFLQSEHRSLERYTSELLKAENTSGWLYNDILWSEESLYNMNWLLQKYRNDPQINLQDSLGEYYLQLKDGGQFTYGMLGFDENVIKERFKSIRDSALYYALSNIKYCDRRDVQRMYDIICEVLTTFKKSPVNYNTSWSYIDSCRRVGHITAAKKYASNQNLIGEQPQSLAETAHRITEHLILAEVPPESIGITNDSLNTLREIAIERVKNQANFKLAQYKLRQGMLINNDDPTKAIQLTKQAIILARKSGNNLIKVATYKPLRLSSQELNEFLISIGINPEDVTNQASS